MQHDPKSPRQIGFHASGCELVKASDQPAPVVCFKLDELLIKGPEFFVLGTLRQALVKTQSAILGRGGHFQRHLASAGIMKPPSSSRGTSMKSAMSSSVI